MLAMMDVAPLLDFSLYFFCIRLLEHWIFSLCSFYSYFLFLYGLTSSDDELSTLYPKLGLKMDLIFRLSGEDVFPLTLEKQWIILETLQKVVVPAMGAAEVLAYSEGWPDPLGPPETADREDAPYVDIAAVIWDLFSNNYDHGASERNITWQFGWKEEYLVFMDFASGLVARGLNVSVRIMSVSLGLRLLEEPVSLDYLIPMRALIAVKLRHTSLASEIGERSGRKILNSIAGRSDDSWQSLSIEQTTDFGEALSDNFQGVFAKQVQVLSANSTEIEQLYGGWLSQSAETFSIDLSRSFDPKETALVEVDMSKIACSSSIEALFSLNATERYMAVWNMSCEWDETFDALKRFFLSENHTPRIDFIENGTVIGVWRRPVPVKPSLPSENITRLENGAARNWIPWHLDALDQRETILDGNFNATADGTGVNVYLLSSGVRQDHFEFTRTDGNPGSRVHGSWGYNGLDPLADCGDGFAWYHFGTMAASLIAGRTMGVAPNATIWSVRFREACLLESPEIWGPSGFPSAFDTVLSTFQRPGIIVLDTWWSRDRLASDPDDFIESSILSRLRRAAEMDIPIIVPAGHGPQENPPCDNVFTKGKSTIRVASTNGFRHRTFFESTNGTCIDIWAPGGGLASSILGADAALPNAYRSTVLGSFGASWLVAGIAAQYLQLHPKATVEELRHDLIEMSTKDVIIGTGIAPNRLAFTKMQSANSLNQNLRSGVLDAESGDSSGGSNLVLAIVLPISITILLATLIGSTWYARKKRKSQNDKFRTNPRYIGTTEQGSKKEMKYSPNASGNVIGKHYMQTQLKSDDHGYDFSGPNSPRSLNNYKCDSDEKTNRDSIEGPSPKTPRTPTASSLTRSEFNSPNSTEWAIDPSQITICHHADGRPWVLGRGRWGKVMRAYKDGIQLVAVKTLARTTQTNGGQSLSETTNDLASSNFSEGFYSLQEAFSREIALMQWLSRDANVVQFFGAVAHGSQLMLVTELMEGGDLRAALTSDVEGNLRWFKSGKHIALDVAKGLHFLHSHGVVHRDVKSKNILLTRDGRAKLADVGLAHILKETQNVSSPNNEEQGSVTGQVGGIIGTFAWAAPEMMLGDAFTSKADIYSFGVVLWELATQEVPIRGRMHIPLPSDDCPSELADIITACMALNPDKRPTARQVFDMILRCPPTQDSLNRDGIEAYENSSPISLPGQYSSSGSSNSHNTVGVLGLSDIMQQDPS